MTNTVVIDCSALVRALTDHSPAGFAVRERLGQLDTLAAPATMAGTVEVAVLAETAPGGPKSVGGLAPPRTLCSVATGGLALVAGAWVPDMGTTVAAIAAAAAKRVERVC